MRSDHCQSGVTACSDALATRVADPLVNIGSFSDWSVTDMAFVAGSEPDGAIVNRQSGRPAPLVPQARGAFLSASEGGGSGDRG